MTRMAASLWASAVVFFGTGPLLSTSALIRYCSRWEALS